MTLRKATGGFTLIELMIVVVIIAALLLVALPGYQNYMIRGHRAAAQAEMLDLANRQQQYLLANRTYTDDPLDLSYSLPPDVASHYSFSLSTVSSTAMPQFEINFTAIGAQTEDGDLSLNSEGERSPVDKWAR